jgi:hypothetical protein
VARNSAGRARLDAKSMPPGGSQGQLNLAVGGPRSKSCYTARLRNSRRRPMSTAIEVPFAISIEGVEVVLVAAGDTEHHLVRPETEANVVKPRDAIAGREGPRDGCAFGNVLELKLGRCIAAGERVGGSDDRVLRAAEPMLLVRVARDGNNDQRQNNAGRYADDPLDRSRHLGVLRAV